MAANNGATVASLLDAGEIVFKGTYHAARVETINWRDAKTGQRMTAQVLRHTLLVGPDAVSVGERVPDGADLSGYQSPFKSGQRVLCLVRTVTLQRGVRQVEGTLRSTQE